MTGKAIERYSNPAFIYHLINWCTYLAYRFLKIFIKPKQSKENRAPLIITGLFRSGTTITSRIIQDMSFSAGPEDHLLKAIGSRKELNPNGFMENHFCMELSMYLFYKTNSWGDAPPEKLGVDSSELVEEDDNRMVWFSLTKIHDDRISNMNKLKVQLSGSASDPKSYFNSLFSDKSFVKNPHIAVLFPYFKKLFPNSKVLVVFRNPFDAVNSAKKVSPLVNYELYNSYYEEMCSEFRSGNKNILFFSYDNLIQNPENSLNNLTAILTQKLRNPGIQKPSYLQKKEITGHSKLNEAPESTLALYKYMIENCINK